MVLMPALKANADSDSTLIFISVCLVAISNFSWIKVNLVHFINTELTTHTDRIIFYLDFSAL